MRMGVCCMARIAPGKKFAKRLKNPKVCNPMPIRVHLVGESTEQVVMRRWHSPSALLEK